MLDPSGRPLTLAETATAIGRSKDWFYRNWQGLVARSGFPQPLPLPGRKLWPAAAVDSWRAGLPPPAAPITAAKPANLDYSGDLLDRRLAAMGKNRR